MTATRTPDFDQADVVRLATADLIPHLVPGALLYLRDTTSCVVVLQPEPSGALVMVKAPDGSWTSLVQISDVVAVAMPPRPA